MMLIKSANPKHMSPLYKYLRMIDVYNSCKTVDQYITANHYLYLMYPDGLNNYDEYEKSINRIKRMTMERLRS
jgi:hypothetical protein